MEAKIQKQVVDYFSFFEDSYSACKSSLKECYESSLTLSDLVSRYQKISKSVISNSPLESYPDIVEKLCQKLHDLANERIRFLRKRQYQLDDLHEKLENKLNNLTKSCSEVDYNSNSKLVRGSSLQPKLATLLELANDALLFILQVCSRIDLSLEFLSASASVTPSFTKNFIIQPELQNLADEILSLTQFCSQNSIEQDKI